jgi:multidrug resistance efflux pump
MISLDSAKTTPSVGKAEAIALQPSKAREDALAQVRDAVSGRGLKRSLSVQALVLPGALGLATLAAFIPLDVSVRGVGMMLSEAGSGPVVAGISGIIEEVSVPMRGTVSEGQVLTRIKSDGDSTVGALQERIMILESRALELSELIEYFRTGRSFSKLASYSEYQAWNARVASFEARIIAASQVIDASSIGVEQSQNALTLAQERLETQRDLAQKGWLARNRILEAELAFTEIRRSYETARSTLAQARLTLEGARREQESAGAELLARLESEQRNLAERLQELHSSLQTTKLTKSNTMVTAPKGGYVEAVEPLYVGKNVDAGAALYNLTPTSSDFVIKASVNNRDVGYVSVDDMARVRIPSLGGGRFRTFKAKVTRVSEEAVPQPPAMMMLSPDARRPPDFVVHLELVDATPGDSLRLRAGMHAEAEIAVREKRSAAAFLTQAIADRGFRPMSEP